MNTLTRESKSGYPESRERGTILIVVMVVLFALASLVLALGRDARTDAALSANLRAAAEADMIERGAEQYVMALLEGQKDTIEQMTADQFENVPVGQGAFWIVRPTYGDTNRSEFGLVDECGKVDLNTVTYDRLMQMPGMTEQIAASIIDWRDTDDTATEGAGAESSTYNSRPEPYNAKNAPFECVEELAMVDGVTPEFLYGDESAKTNDSTLGSMFSEDYLLSGYFDRFTCWGLADTTVGGSGGNTAGAAQALAARVNVNTAPKEVLMSILNMTEATAQEMIDARATSVQSDPTNTDWAQQYLPGNAAQNQITGQGAYFSADIVAVGSGGRAFKRVRIVVATLPSVKIVYRRDITDRGLPQGGADFLQQKRDNAGGSR
jgi:type II secretory pathway component PulK